MCGLSSWHLCNGKTGQILHYLKGCCNFVLYSSWGIAGNTLKGQIWGSPTEGLNHLDGLSAINMDIGVSMSHLYSLSITLPDPCILWQVSSECPESLGHLKVDFELVNMCISFLSSHHICLGTWVCRYFLTILTKYHFIKEAKCKGFSNQHPNQTFVTTWRQPVLRKLQCWTQVLCGYIGIIEETRIWEMSGNHIFSPSSLLLYSIYYLLCSINIIVFVLVKFLQILYNGQCAQTSVWRQ